MRTLKGSWLNLSVILCRRSWHFTHHDEQTPPVPHLYGKMYTYEVRCSSIKHRIALERQLLQLWNRSVWLRNDQQLKLATDSSRLISIGRRRFRSWLTYAKEVVRSSVWCLTACEREENTLHSNEFPPCMMKTLESNLPRKNSQIGISPITCFLVGLSAE